MKWTVLADNRTNDPALETEHGLSILLETARHRILLDTGASEVLIELAKRLTKAYPNSQFHTSHCTGDKVFATLKTIMGEHLHAFSCGSKQTFT